DVVLAVPVVAPEPQPFFRHSAGEIVLGQVRAIARGVGIGAEDGDVTGKTDPPKLMRASEAGGAAADNHDLADVGLYLRGLGLSLDLAPDERLFAFDLHLPPIDRVERRGAKRGACSKVETGVVERAADAGVSDHAVGEIPAIMGAGPADRVELAVDVGQQHCIVADPAGHRGAVGNLGKADPFGEVGTGSACCFTHLRSPPARSNYWIAARGERFLVRGRRRWLPGPDSNRRPSD